MVQHSKGSPGYTMINFPLSYPWVNSSTLEATSGTVAIVLTVTGAVKF